MKRSMMMRYIITCAIFVIFFAQCVVIEAKLLFSNQSSDVKLHTGSTLIIGSSIAQWDGTLSRGSTTLIEGEKIFFSQGIFSQLGFDAVMTATYDPTGDDTIILEDGSSLRFEPGFVTTPILVKGSDNRIEGQPNFMTPILLDGDPATQLHLAIKSPFNQLLDLNGATLFLDANLELGSEAKIVGSGVIRGNKTFLRLAKNDGTLTATLSFSDSVGVQLNSKTLLRSEWRFSGINQVNGNGNVLYLAGGGKLLVDDGAKLFLSDITVKGLTNESLQLLGPNSHIKLTNVTLDFADDITFLQGFLDVEGITYFILHDKNCTVKKQARLTVDSTTLWLDVNISAPVGSLNAPRPIFVNHMPDESNQTYDLASFNLQLLNHGIIREISELASSDATDDESLIDPGGVSHDLVLHKSRFIQPDQTIHIVSDVTIDGTGAILVFSDPNHPQFIIEKDKTVRLKNISLSKLNAHTFQFAEGSKLEIAENVLFECEEDIVFNDGQLGVVGSVNNPIVFSIQGLGGKRKVTLVKSRFGESTFNLGVNALQLQNIELEGVERISVSQKQTSDGFLLVGSIALSGNSTVNVRTDAAMSFFVEGLHNICALEANNLTFKQFFIFGEHTDNDIHFSLRLPEGGATAPGINFVDDALFVHSDQGRARVFFDNNFVIVRTLGSNSFVVSDNSFLASHTVFISGPPIKQISADFELAVGATLDSSSPNAIDASFIRGEKKKSRLDKKIITALQFIRQKKKKGSAVIVQAKKEKSKKKATSLFRATNQLPSEGVRTINGSIVKEAEATGDIQMFGGAMLTDFGIGGALQKSFMQGNATIAQGIKDTIVKESDEINVTDFNNNIIVRKLFQIFGQLNFDANSALTIDMEKGAVFDLSLIAGNILRVPSGTTLKFQGEGVVYLPQNIEQIDDASGASESAKLIVADLVTVKMKNPGRLQLAGKLDIYVQGGGRFSIEAGHNVVFGGKDTDKIGLEVSSGGLINVNGLSAQSNGVGVGTLTFQKASYDLKVTQNGIFKIGPGGVCIINKDKDTRGNLTNFEVSHEGVLSIHNDGELVIGRNREPASLMINFLGGNIEGTGFFTFAENPKFSGRIQAVSFGRLLQLPAQKLVALPGASNPLDTLSDAEQLTRMFINTRPDLSVTTVFIGKAEVQGKDEVQRARFKPEYYEMPKNIRIIDFFKDDVIYGDNKDTGAIEGKNQSQGRAQGFIVRKRNNTKDSDIIREP